MAVEASDLKLYGSSSMPQNDDDVNGGGINTGDEIIGVLGEVFTDAYSKDTGEGNYTQYRKVFFKNTNVSSSLTEAKIWVSSDPESQIAIAVESSKNGSDTSTNRLTAPGGYSFVDAADEEDAIAVPTGELAAGEAIGVWVRLLIPEAQTPLSSVEAKLTIKGKTAA